MDGMGVAHVEGEPPNVVGPEKVAQFSVLIEQMTTLETEITWYINNPVWDFQIGLV